jgi:hypothetical protein
MTSEMHGTLTQIGAQRMDYRDLDLDDLSDTQLTAIVQALRDSDGDEPTELLTLLEGEIALRKRRGTLQ